MFLPHRSTEVPLRVQAILAHPLPDSFAAAVHRTAVAALRRTGHQVVETDLYGEGFDPRLTADERAGYYAPHYDTAAVEELVRRLRWSEGLVLAYPHWWFDMPAMLKGYFDRVWAPGVAFRHDLAGGRIVPLLTGLRKVTVLTSFGSPWWVAELYMRNPARRILRAGLLTACTRGVTFDYVAHYDMDRSTPKSRARHLDEVEERMRAF